MLAIILAQGDGRRWELPDPTFTPALGGPYLGRRKQSVEVDGETLIGRAERLFRERGCDVLTVAHPELAEHVVGRLVTADDAWPTGTDQDKFFMSRPWWSPDARTVILWGDCWYSEAAADTIVNHPSDDLHYFRRPGPSRLTGHRWDESFAVSFGVHEHDRVLRLAEAAVEAVRSGRIGRTKIRTHYALSLGLDEIDDGRLLFDTPGQTIIDDWTDDLDSPYDYAQWVGGHQAGKLNVAVCLPWMGGDRHRTRAKEFTVGYYEALGVPVVLADDDSGGEWTNRARACNNAVAEARRLYDPDVVLIGDSDTVIDAPAVWASAHAAAITGRMVVAFRDYLKLNRRTSSAPARKIAELGVTRERWRQHRRRPECVALHKVKHVSGAVALSVDAFDAVGGMDERFNAWGGEDRAFWMACHALLGRPWRIDATAYHLYHPVSPERADNHPARAAVLELGHRYKRASGWLSAGGVLGALAPADAEPDVSAMTVLMCEPGGPLAPVSASA